MILSFLLPLYERQKERIKEKFHAAAGEMLLERNQYQATALVMNNDRKKVHFMMMQGTKFAMLRQVQLVDIHGTRFYDIGYSLDDTPDQVHSARIGVEDAYVHPQPGDVINVRFLMNVVVGITQREL